MIKINKKLLFLFLIVFFLGVNTNNCLSVANFSAKTKSGSTVSGSVSYVNAVVADLISGGTGNVTTAQASAKSTASNVSSIIKSSNNTSSLTKTVNIMVTQSNSPNHNVAVSSSNTGLDVSCVNGATVNMNYNTSPSSPTPSSPTPSSPSSPTPSSPTPSSPSSPTPSSPATYSPTATNLSVNKGNYCVTPSHYFSWTYNDNDGHTEIRYQFQVDNNNNFSSPEINRDISNSTINNQTVVVSVSLLSDQIEYNIEYYWRVKVYDSSGADSGWVSSSSFTTDKHMWPIIDFSWLPVNPSEGEDVFFTDLSTVYGGVTKSIWSWIFENGNPTNSNQQNPTTKFTSTGDKQITLQLTDSDSYSCSESKTINIQALLPSWEEK